MENELLVGTSSLICDFIANRAILYAKKREYNDIFLSDKEQSIFIAEIFNSVHKIKDDGTTIFCIINSDGIQIVEKNFKNFLLVTMHRWRKLFENGFCAINLEDLFEIIKTKKIVQKRKVSSIFFEKNRFFFDTQKEEIVEQKKIKFIYEKHDIDDEIVEAIDKHWQGNIRTIIEHIVASMHTTDKKNLWLLILANSNFGKSKLFDWMLTFGGAVFVDFKDLKAGGISNKSPDEFDGKLCLVVDEVKNFPRAMFAVEGEILIRPMRNHSISVPVNSKILLSADGGTFNLEYIDKQISNRVAVMDFRGGEYRELGALDIVKKYGEYKIKRAMTNYLYSRIVDRQSYYMSLELEDRRDMADKNIKWIFSKFKQKKLDFFEIVSRDIYEIIDNPKQLDDRHLDIYNTATMYYNTTKKSGLIFVRPSDTIPKILKHYDANIAYELEFKTIEQIANGIKGFELGVFKIDGKTVRGLFVPSRVPVIVEGGVNNVEYIA